MPTSDARLIDVLGLRTRYVVRGSGPPVLVLHGWGASIEAVHPIVTGLSPVATVYALDLPGFGRSDLPPEPWGVEGLSSVRGCLHGRAGDRGIGRRGPLQRRAHRDSHGSRRAGARIAARAGRLGGHPSEAHAALVSPGGDGEDRQVRTPASSAPPASACARCSSGQGRVGRGLPAPRACCARRS